MMMDDVIDAHHSDHRKHHMHQHDKHRRAKSITGACQLLCHVQVRAIPLNDSMTGFDHGGCDFNFVIDVLIGKCALLHSLHHSLASLTLWISTST